MNEKQTLKGQSQEVNIITQYAQKFLPYWPLFVVSVALAITVAYIKLRAEQPMYVAFGKVMLTTPEKGSESKVLDEFSIVGGQKQVENEILVLRSTLLMKKVVKSLNIGATVFNEGRVRVEELYKENSPVSFIPLNPDSVGGGGQYYFSVDWVKGEVSINDQKVPFNGVLKIAGSSYRVVPTLTYNKHIQGKNYYVVFDSADDAAASLASSLTVNPISLTSSVIDVSITTAVPEKGKDILNKLFNVYEQTGVLEKRQTANNTLEFIDGRIADVAMELDSAESNVVRYQTDQAITTVEEQGSTAYAQAVEFEQQRNETELQLRLLGNVKSAILSGNSAPATGGITDPSLTATIVGLQQAESDLRKLETTEGASSDPIRDAKERVATMRKNVLDNINNVQRSLGSARSAYGSLMGRSMGRVRQNPQRAKALAGVMRQQDVKSTIYNYLLEKREETELNSAGMIADMKILETPAAFGPVSPVPKTFYTKWLMIGLIIPAAFVFLKDLLNRTVQFRSEIEQKTDVPVVAEISQIDSENPIVIREGKRTAVAEQFRALRTNLTFMGLGEKTNTILVTSSSSGEGKSFTAVNLAISFTLIGKKVALLELDLRKPKISKLLSLRNDVGISNYLVNQATISDIIKPTEIKDLYILPSGIIPPNPAELLLKQKFKELMAEVKSRFDFVIIDTAPVGPVADSYLLKDYADATVYMVRQNKTLRSNIKLIEDAQKKHRFNNLCIVFNGIKKRSLSYSSAGYGSYGADDGYYVQEENEGRINVIGKRLKKMVGIKG